MGSAKGVTDQGAGQTEKRGQQAGTAGNIGNRGDLVRMYREEQGSGAGEAWPNRRHHDVDENRIRHVDENVEDVPSPRLKPPDLPGPEVGKVCHCPRLNEKRPHGAFEPQPPADTSPQRDIRGREHLNYRRWWFRVVPRIFPGKRTVQIAFAPEKIHVGDAVVIKKKAAIDRTKINHDNGG